MFKLTVEVAYASEKAQRIIELNVPQGTTVHEAIQLSHILNIFPEIDLTQQKVGIFSKVCELTEKIKDGDRIEIYRPLVIDPKEARRTRSK